MLRLALAFGLFFSATAALAQGEPGDIIVRTLLDHDCELTDVEARSLFDAQDLPWETVLDELNRMERLQMVVVARDGRKVVLLPPTCHPEPITVDRPGPSPGGWISERLAQEDECRLPLAALRADGLAAGLDPEWFEQVIESFIDLGDLRQEGGDVVLEPARCARFQNPEDWDLLAITNAFRHEYANAIAEVLRARACRMPMAEDATVQALADEMVVRLDLDLPPAGLSPLARGVVEDRVREVLMDRADRFAIETASGDLVLLGCPS